MNLSSDDKDQRLNQQTQQTSDFDHPVSKFKQDLIFLSKLNPYNPNIFCISHGDQMVYFKLKSL